MAAGFGLNSRHANSMPVLVQLDHARQEPDSGLIACRICDHIFMSRKALFDHMELHLLLDESATRKQLLLSHLQSTQTSLFAYRFNQNSPQLLSTRQQVLHPEPKLSTLHNGYASSTLPRERNPLSIGTNARKLDLQSTTTSPIPFRFKNNNMLLRTHPTLSAAPQITFVPQPHVDYVTRPFLDQLEATLLVDGMASFMDREIAAGKLGDQQVLDLTLKHGREEN